MVFFSKSNAIEQDIEQASDYAEYREACLAHDAQSARKLQDVTGLMSILHEGLHGNLGNIANPALLTHSKTGTKQLIETFISEVVMALDAIYRADESVVDFFHKKQFFEETAHAFGRSCLMLSGGAGLGFFHAGVVKSLNEHNLLPTVISGASAGAIIAAMIGTKNQQELQEALSPEFILSKFRYWRKWSGFGRKSLLDATALENTLIELFDLMTFEEAFSKTGRHINISVSPMDLHQQSRVLLLFL